MAEEKVSSSTKEVRFFSFFFFILSFISRTLVSQIYVVYPVTVEEHVVFYEYLLAN